MTGSVAHIGPLDVDPFREPDAAVPDLLGVHGCAAPASARLSRARIRIRKMLGDRGIAHEPLDFCTIDLVQEAKQVGQPGSSVGGGHGFGHGNTVEPMRTSGTT
jgi:hypothetical protein